MGKVSEAVLALGEEEFTRRMEGIPSAERREIFGHLDVPRAGASASARQRTLRRIRIAWERFGESPSEEAAETLARAWLERHGMAMIVDFLDHFDVEHDGGFLKDENAVAKLPAADVPGALRDLAERHDPHDVRLYAAVMALPGT